MSEKDNGGPAFPVSSNQDINGEVGHQDSGDTWQYPGLYLRDYFAAKALPIAMTVPWRDVGYSPADGLTDFEQHARLAYQIADAMLSERAK